MVRSLFNNLSSITNWLCASFPSFPVKADQISVLYKPDEYYETLIDLCSQANRRILLVSLYLGTGEKEKKLVNIIQSRAREQCSTIKIKILLDAMRGSRGSINSSRTMLLPLLQQSPHCQVALFHTPKLKGILRSLLPPRYNELIGLLHMKICVIDNNVIISGANLSNIYFSNRQDRYILVKNCEPLANFFDGLIKIFCDLSFQLNDSNSITFPYTAFHPYKESTNVYVTELKNQILNYYSSFISYNKNVNENDTWIFPTIEVPPCDIHIDSELTKNIIDSVPENAVIHLASGYFNLTEELVDAILLSKAKINLLMAHPTTNGFYQSSGFSRYIPSLYTAISKEFYDKIKKNFQQDRIKSFEYIRKDWTFHGKGIWITFPGETLPQLTVIGSSNFGFRSKQRDLESQIVIVTNNKNLKERLFKEQQQLFEYGVLLSDSVFLETKRKIPFWSNSFVWFLKSFF